MKIVLFIVFLFLIFVKIGAQKTITCKAQIIDNTAGCLFSGVTIGKNENVVISTDPVNLDVNIIIVVQFISSSIDSVPPEIFTKFPNMKWLYAWTQQIQEVRPETFVNAKKLEYLGLHYNALTQLHVDAFKGKIFEFHIFKNLLKII
jgi:hypothetical protein